jgi:hypothetical protein
MSPDTALRSHDDTIDIVASFRQILADIDALPREHRAGSAPYADMGFPGKDIRLFIHRGVRCRLYQRHAVEPYVGTPVDPTHTVSLTLADYGEQREYTYVLGGGDRDENLSIRRRVSRPGDWRSSWRQLNDTEAHALLQIVGSNGVEELTRLLTLVTDLSPREKDALYVPRARNTRAPTRPAMSDRWHLGVGLAAAVVVVALLASVVTQSVASSPQGRIRILQAYVSTPIPAAATRTTKTTTGGHAGRVNRPRPRGAPPGRAATVTATPGTAPKSTWVAAVGGAHWPCDLSPAINVDIDPTGATAQELAYDVTALQEAATDTGRPMIITKAPFSPSVVQAPDTIYVAWHGIDGVPPTTGLHPAWTALYVNYPPLADGSTTPEFSSADTVFGAGLPQVAYYHETGREFGLGDSPYRTDDGYGGNFEAARVPPHQDFSSGDIAGLRAGASGC